MCSFQRAYVFGQKVCVVTLPRLERRPGQRAWSDAWGSAWGEAWGETEAQRPQPASLFLSGHAIIPHVDVPQIQRRESDLFECRAETLRRRQGATTSSSTAKGTATSYRRQSFDYPSLSPICPP